MNFWKITILVEILENLDFGQIFGKINLVESLEKSGIDQKFAKILIFFSSKFCIISILVKIIGKSRF